MILILQMNVRMMQFSSHLASKMCFMALDQELCPNGVTVGEKWSESGAMGLQLPVGLNKLLLRRLTEARQEMYFSKTLNRLFTITES